MIGGARVRRLAARLCLAWGALSGCSARHEDVTRVLEGVPQRGPFIQPESYAGYLRGILHELRGNPRAALFEYCSVLTEAADDAALRTRIVATKCRIPPAEHAQLPCESGPLSTSLAQLTRDAPNYAPAWYESGRCFQHLKRDALGLGPAWRALELDPERIQTSILVAELSERLGKLQAARAVLDALVSFAPGRESYRALYAFAERTGDAARSLRAARALEALQAWPKSARRAPDPSAFAGVDRALRARQFEAALRAAQPLGLSRSEVSARAAALGMSDLAEREALRLLAADPTETTAWIVALIAADLKHEDDAFEALLEGFAGARMQPSVPLAQRMFGELLQRRCGAAAARSWLAGSGPLPAPKDALEQELNRRLSLLKAD